MLCSGLPLPLPGIIILQWRDILGVLKVQAGRLDLNYLRKWATELNVADLLQRAMKESE